MLTLHAISRIEGGPHDGIHLLWSPPYPTGHSLDGFTIWRRATKGRLKPQCWDLTAAVLDEARMLGVTHVGTLTVWARPRSGKPGSGQEWTYRVDLGTTTDRVDLTGTACVCAFAARDTAIVDGQAFTANLCTLRGSDIGTVWVVTKSTKASFKLCIDQADASAWAQLRPIVSNLQVPFRAVNASVTTEAQERALAASRAAPDPLAGSYTELSQYANLALARPDGIPAFRVVAGRLGGAQNHWDLAPYPLSIAAIAIAEWHRALGFAHRDHADLVPGNVYDYRIAGTVPRADRDEQRFDFHTVPRNYRLPQCFVLGPVTVWTGAPSEVVAESINGSPAVLRKGIKFTNLFLDLPVPTRRLVVDGSSSNPVTARGFMLGAHVGDVAVVLSTRSAFDFPAPVDRIELDGEGFLVGLVPQPLAAALDPKEPVEISATFFGVAYVATPSPPPPDALQVVTIGDPSRTARVGAPDANRGFEVSWRPPLAIDATLAPWWPVDAGSYLPTAIARYRIERRIGTGGFTPSKGTDGLHIGTRVVQTVTDTPAWGFDVLRAFPPMGTGGTPTDERVRATEVFERAQLDYGDSATYRVRCVDAVGRESVPAVAPPAMLRKFTRPPPPTSPPIDPAVPADTPRSGIQVRLIQADDPDLTPEDAALAAGSDVVVVRWGWGLEERQLDPYVTEFRLYEHHAALVELTASLSGTVAAAGTGWSVPVTFSRPVAASEFVGSVITLNDAYAITAHGAGTNVTVSLAPSVRSPATVPQGARLTLLRTSGAQLQPEFWDRRALVVPRAGDPAREDDATYVEAYTATLPAAWIAVGPGNVSQRAAIGVAAADAQGYVADRRAAVEPAPRPGNESTVSAVEVTARYRGRPTLAVADLADVAETVLRRAGAHDTFHVFTPSALAPAGAVLLPTMRVERVPASAVLPRVLIRSDAILLQPMQGAPVAWVLSAADQAALRAGQAAGNIPNRFLAHAAARLDGLERQAVKVADVDPTRELSDAVPNTPGRWVYRLRAVNAAGRLSAAGQVLGLVLRVPTPARSTTPEMVSLTLQGDHARLTVRSRGTEPARLLVFTSLDPRQRLAQASLATIRNRPDLDPTVSVVVRDDRGLRLAATSVSIAPNTDIDLDIPLPDGHRLLAWSVSLSSDGVPSQLVGPLHTARGYLPGVG